MKPTRREFLVMSGSALAAIGCGGSSSGGSNSPFYRATLWYFFDSPSTSLAGQPMSIVAKTDIEALEAQSGQANNAGGSIYIGGVATSAGAAVSGAEVKAFTDAGAQTGVVVYRNSSGVLNPALTATTSNGGFVIFSVTPGRTNVQATTGANGNTYVSGEADGATLVDVVVTGGPYLVISMSGITRDGTGAAEPSVVMNAFGFGAPFPVTSNGVTGAFGAFTVPSNHEIYFKLTKAGFLDTYTLFKTGTVSITTPAGDLQIFEPTERDAAAFKPASLVDDITKGIINGLVKDSGGTLQAGATVEARTPSGALTGTVVYSDAAGSADGALTSTTASGEFTVFNADPGATLVVASAAGVKRAISVEVFANSITIVPDLLRLTAATSPTISVAGSTFTTAGSALAETGVQIFGVGSTTSNGFAAYSFGSVPSNGRLIARTTHA